MCVTRKQMFMKKQKVVIIGAGGSGLIAANQLAAHCDIVVVEALQTPGGRMRSLMSPSSGAIIEAGAEFVHGNLPLTQQLVKEAKLSLLKIDGKMLRKEKSGWVEQKEMVEGWDTLLEKMKNEPRDTTMHDFLETRFPGPQYAGLKKHVDDFVNGFDLASTRDISMKSLYREWNAEEAQYRLKEGYSALVAHLYAAARGKGCRFIFGDAVKQVNWKENSVTAVTASGDRIEANKVIVSIPVALMAAGAIQFTPGVDEYAEAYKHVGYGTVTKVILEFSKRFWADDVSFMFSEETIPTWWTQYPLAGTILTGWAGGRNAAQLAGKSPVAVADTGLEVLSSIFSIAKKELSNILTNSYVFNWLSYEHFSGAYSYSKVESETVRKILQTPKSGTIFFAGEGLIGGEYPGTVEAALQSGANAAKQVLDMLQ